MATNRPSFQHRRTSVAGRVPTPADLEEGELGINLPDRKLFTKDENGNIVQVGTGDCFSKAEADLRYVQQGVLPVSRFGTLNDDPLPISFSGLNMNVTAAIPVLLSGRQYELPIQSNIALAASKTLNVYVSLSAGQAVLVVTESSLPEAVANMFIGSVITGASSVTSNTLAKVSRLDLYRPSATQRGSAFAVSTGTPDKTGTINW